MNQLTITPILIEKEVDRHSYLMTYGLHHVLLDPAAHYHSDALLRQVQSIIAIDKIEYIILQSNDFLNISSLDAIINAGFKSEKRIDAISRFHEQTLPSSDFVRHALKKLKGYDIHLIFPTL